ncbi:MAG: 3-oxoacyl-[acyl-carrier protein] reductase [Chlamydiales bacterium]
MSTAFENQSVIVTGGTRGLGKATAMAFLEAGARVFATYRGNEEAAAALLDEAASHAGRLSTHRFDVADYAAVETFWEELDDLAPDGIQVLVNNSGIRRDSVLAMMSSADWSSVIETNLTGSFHMSKFAVKNMVSQRYGRIVFVTSPAGRFGFEGQGNYSASKAGQVGLSRALSKEVARRGITVNCVSPGFIDTELLSDLPEAKVAEYKKSVPMRRFGTPQEVAHATLFLASKEASYVTGATLEVSGGF